MFLLCKVSNSPYLKEMKICCAVAFLFFSWSASAADARQVLDKLRSLEGWKEIEKTDDGITSYSKPEPGSQLMGFKGTALVPAPLEKMVSITLDRERASEWMDNLLESRTVRGSFPAQYILYDHIHTSPVTQDRDFVTKVITLFEPKDKAVISVFEETQDEDAPVRKHVRGSLGGSITALVSAEGGKSTLVWMDVHADPRGSIAAWMVNATQSGFARNTIRGMRKQAAKANVEIHAAAKDLFKKR